MKLRERESNLKKRQDEIQKTLSCTYLDKDINNLLVELDTVKEHLEQIVNNQTRGRGNYTITRQTLRRQ